MATHESNPYQAKRATIIGGSIAGLCAGIALLKHGWDVHIYESAASELERRGAGVTIHPSLFKAFGALDIYTDNDFGINISTRKAFARDGSVIGTYELEQVVTSWARVYQLLKSQFPPQRYHQDKFLINCTQIEETVEAIFADGTKVMSNILVAADGIRSTVRSFIESNAKPEYAGYVAWRGLIDEINLDQEELKELFPYFTFCLPEGEQVLCYPVAGEQHQTEIGQRRYNVVWYRPADKNTTLKSLLTDIEGNNNGESIAPDRIRPVVVNSMRDASRHLLSPQHAKLMEKLHQPFIQPIYDLTTDSMSHNLIALIGDAAFTARPHLGMGITKAADDALTLAQTLNTNASLVDAIKQFDEIRRPVNLELVNSSRALGAYLQAQLTSESERRHAQLHRTTDAVMRETANMMI